MRIKPTYEPSDRRVSERYAMEERRRQKERNKAEKKLGCFYFTNKKGESNEVRTFD